MERGRSCWNATLSATLMQVAPPIEHIKKGIDGGRAFARRILVPQFATGHKIVPEKLRFGGTERGAVTPEDMARLRPILGMGQ